MENSVSLKPISFIVGGDLAPTESNFSCLTEGNINALFDDKLISLINSADYKLFNLEVPLTDTLKPISKDGPNLVAPASVINGLKLLDPVIFGLANNHIMDQDEQGLYKTMEQLSRNQLKYVGAAENLAGAVKPLIVEKDGTKIGIYACAENEFSIAEEHRAGANPFDPLESLDHIVNLKSECDYVLVLFHGGKEHYRYPSPGLRKVCRKMADKGADLIICQHSHCIGAFERYSRSVIVYGQGNFLFDRRNNEYWNTSLLVNAVFGKELTVEFIPVCKKGNGVSLPESVLSQTVLKEFNQRSENILKPGFVEAEYDRFCKSNGIFYLGAFAGFGRILRRIDKLLNGMLTRLLYSSKKLYMLQNFVECEAHRELFLRYLHVNRKK
jgi:poly-gamma-glutamate capsule biosynthesis protein CapA/YwtB (metallophosphatase superfamily)